MSTAVNANGIMTRVAGGTITQYARVKLDTSNQVVEADADDKGIGTSLGVNIVSGDHVAIKLWSAPGTHKVIANGAFTINDLLYGHDNGEVDDDPDFGVTVGRASETTTAAGDIIEMIPVDEDNGLIFAGRADSASITNTTTPTNFDKTKTIDGAELQIGDVIEVIARVHLVATNSTDTLDLALLFGTETIGTTGAVDVADNDVGYIHAFITIRTLGVSGTLSATILTALGVSGTAAVLPKRKDEATEDMTGDLLIAVQATWSVADPGNDVILEDLIVIKHRQ